MKNLSFRFLFTIILLIMTNQINAQQTYCGSSFYPPDIQTTDPARYVNYIQLEQFIRHYLDTVSQSKFSKPLGRLSNPNSTIIIPVVVHVLHNGEPIGTGNNISDAQVQSQIDVLNEDFRRLNTDRVNTPATFAPVAADPNVEFRLTCVDPNGNPTNGIDRVQTNIITFQYHQNNDGSTNELATGIKFTSQSGVDAWPTDHYLNIWVCNIAPNANGQLLGYGQFPFDYASSPNTDGVVIFNRAFGRVDGNFLPGYAEGRTATHEVGHWLDLFHIWGDDGTSCSGSDSCNDTPNQAGPNQSDCPGFPHVSCSNGPNGDMFMNYMDYTLDACKNIYTQDQVARMRAIFAQGGPRSSFINNYFSINAPSSVCSAATLSVTNPLCLPVTWSIMGSATLSSTTGNTVTITKTGDGFATVTATVGSYTDTKKIPVGMPVVFGSYNSNGLEYGLVEDEGIFEPSNPVCYTGPRTVMYTDMDISGASSATWSKLYPTGPGLLWAQAGNYDMAITFRTSTEKGIFRVDATNICGTTSKRYSFEASTCGQFVVYPNPAGEKIMVMAVTNKTDNIPGKSVKIIGANKSEGIKVIEIHNASGKLVKQLQFSSHPTQVQIDVSALIPGIYFLKISKDSHSETHKVVIAK